MTSDRSSAHGQPPTVLYQIKVLVEAASVEEVETLSDEFESVICNADHDDSSVRCARRWFIVIDDLTADEATEWEELLNE